MASWTIANLSNLDTPFLTLESEHGDGDRFIEWVAAYAGPYSQWNDPGSAEWALDKWRSVPDPDHLLDDAEVVSVEYVYHCIRLGRAHV